MNSADKKAVLHCLKAMIDEEVCEECLLYGTTGTDHCEKDCVRLAINALEQEPCEDCVSRQAALRQAINAHKMAQENGFDFKDICEEYLNVLPPVTPKQRTGHWIKYCTARDGEQHYQCTACEYYVNFGIWGEVYTKQFKYCPNCGAKMKEGD